ncbi:MAG: electron transport complex subunit RsxG [Shewanella sp.]|nr:electron transport complex subunit RsxG [Shewanella sp.]
MNNPMIKNGLILALFAMVCTGVVAFVDKLTAERIAEQKKAQRLKVLQQIIPQSLHDNVLTEHCTLVYEPNVLGSDEALPAFIATTHDKPTAIALEVIAPDGYNGAIKLTMAVNNQNELLGVRTLTHNETPGLGDKIMLSKSDWVNFFTDKPIIDTNKKDWKVKKDGGVIDQFSGATITPRAYAKAVSKASLYLRDNFDKISRQTRTCEDTNG